jgi:drug/metabolite transporter (DMT)-like permease
LKCQNQKFNPDTLKNKRSKWLLFLKVVLSISAFTCFLLALNRLPIGILSVLDNTSPFWSMILGYIIFKESFSTLELIATLGAFIGVSILALASQNSTDIELEETQEDSRQYILGIIFIVVGAWFFSGIGIVTRYIGESIPATLQIFYYQLCASILFSVILLIEWAVIGGNFRIMTYSGM